MLTKTLVDKKDNYWNSMYYDPHLKLFYDVELVNGNLAYTRCHIPGKSSVCPDPDDIISKKKHLRICMGVPNGIHGDYINLSREIDTDVDLAPLQGKFSPDDYDTMRRFLVNVVNKIPNDYTLCIVNADDDVVNFANTFAWRLAGVSHILPYIPVNKKLIPDYINLLNRIKHFSLITPITTLGVVYGNSPNAIAARFENLPTVGSTMFISRQPNSKIPGLTGSHKTIYAK